MSPYLPAYVRLSGCLAVCLTHACEDTIIKVWIQVYGGSLGLWFVFLKPCIYSAFWDV